MTYGCHQNPTEENALITEECVRISESILTLKMSLYILQRNEFFCYQSSIDQRSYDLTDTEWLCSFIRPFFAT